MKLDILSIVGGIMDLIKAQRELSEKDLMIFTAEVERHSKSAGITYILWFFIGSLGAHNFYMGKVVWGIVCFILGSLGWSLFFIGLIENSDDGAAVGMLGLLLLGVLSVFLLGISSPFLGNSHGKRNKWSRKYSLSLE